MMEERIGTHVHGYEVVSMLGQGGFGAVYTARQTTGSIERDVALKIILPKFANNPDFIRRFEAEAQIIARLEHLHIVPLHDYWRDADGAYLVMRHFRGGSLQQALAQNGTYDLETAARVLSQIGAALTFAHRHQIIHRDLKPGNILLDEDGNAYLADFGIAKDLGVHSGHITDPDEIVGSPGYLAPEQARSEPATPQTDIYSLGVVLYEMLTGEHPFADYQPIEQLFKHLNEPLPDITSLPAEVQADVNRIIQRATAKNPQHRYETVLQLVQDFHEIAGMATTSADESVMTALTNREIEIARLILAELTNQEIADQLVVTRDTVRWYIRQINRKLNVTSRERLIEKLLALGISAQATDAPTSTDLATSAALLALADIENPYKGLLAFQATDARDFFGREKLTQKLLDHMQSADPYHRFLAVIGPSGSGKSSLVRAGLIPALWRGEIPGSEQWFIVDLLPGTHPIDQLETALIRVTANQSLNLHEQLQRDERGLLRVADVILPDDNSELVIIIDQFEELFILTEDEKVRQHFLDLIRVAVSDVRSRVRVVVTLRADYYDRPLMVPEFGEILHTRMQTVLPLSAQGLERAIRGPAERVGLVFEQGLVEQIVSEMNYQTGALPLLQYALTELFDRREGRKITQTAYQQIGGAVGALANRADEIYQALSPKGQALAQQLFLRLVTLGEGAQDTRRRTPQAELLMLSENTDLVEDIIDHFASYRLLSLDRDPDTRQPTVEVAHEALLTDWHRLRTWINDSRESLRHHRQLMQLARDWKTNKEEESYLLRGNRLEQFEQWAESTSLTLTPAEYRFLQTSLTSRAKQQTEEAARLEHERMLEHRVRRVFQVLSVVLLIAALGGIALALVAFDRENKAQAARDDAQAERDRAQDLALVNGARAAYASQDLDTSLALAITANQSDSPSAAAQVILSQAAYDLGTAMVLDQGAFHTYVDVSADGTIALSGIINGVVKVWDLTTGTLLHDIPAHQTTISGVGISPDGQWGYSTANENSIAIWNLTTGELVQRLTSDDLYQNFIKAAFSPDGKTLLSSNGGDPFSFPDQESNLILWDLETGQPIRTFEGHTMFVGKVAFSSDGSTALSGAPFEEIILWDVETGEEIRRTPELNQIPYRMTTDIVYHPDGETALVLFWDTTAARIDLETMETIQTYGTRPEGSNWWTELALSPDGKTLYFYNDPAGRPTLWDVDSGRQLVNLPLATFGRTFGADFLPDGKHVLVGREGDLRLYAIRHGAEINAFSFNSPWWVEVSPDGQTIAVITGTQPQFGELDCAFVLIDVESGTEIQRFGTDTDLMQTIHCSVAPAFDTFAFSPDGQSIFTRTSDSAGILWDVASGDVLQRYEGHALPFSSVAFSPDGETAITGACLARPSDVCEGASELFLWDVASGEPIWRAETPPDMGEFWRVMFSPDGQSILSAHDAQAILWNTATGDLIRAFESETGGMRDALFLPDGSQILTASATGDPLFLWDVESGEQVLSMSIAGRVSGVAVTPDGRYAIATGSQVSLWDLSTGQMVRRYDNADNFWLSPAMHPDGQSFFVFETGGWVIRHWRIDTEAQLVDWVISNRYVRDLTCTERQTYLFDETCER